MAKTKNTPQEDRFREKLSQARFVVLGGAGAMGRITVRDLCETSPETAEITIADYSREKGNALVGDLNRLGFQNVHYAFADVTDSHALVSVLRGHHCVINCAPYKMNLSVMNAALQAGVHYVDLGGLFHVTLDQLKMHGVFQNAGLTAVLGMGAAPGITNLLGRLGAEKLDQVTEIHCRVASSDRTRYEPKPALAVSYTLATILEEFSKAPAVVRKGKMTFVEPMSGDIPMKFPPPIGVARPMYTIHSEVATLGESYRDKGVKEVSFKIAFDQDFTDKVRFLRDLGFGSLEKINVGGAMVRPIDVVNHIAMNQPPVKTVGKLKQYEVVRTVVKGKSKGKKITWIMDCHTSGMPEWGVGLDIDTGSPPAVAAQMLVVGEIEKAGALPPEKCVPPERFFEHLKRRKMKVTATKKSGWSLIC